MSIRALRLRALLAILLFVSLPISVHAAPIIATPHVLVSDYFRDRIDRFDAATGAFIDTLVSSVNNSQEMEIGPNGNLFVNGSEFNNSTQGTIYRYNAQTGASLGTFLFAPGDPIRGFTFGPNGNLFVAFTNSNRIAQYNGATGAFINNFAIGIDLPISVRFAANGDLLVARGHHQLSNPSSILRLNGTTGALLGTFASAGIDTPQNMVFGPNGDLYVANQDGPNDITRYDGVTGALRSTFSTGHLAGNNPQGMAFLPNGDLIVGSGGSVVRRFDSQSGAYLGNFATGGSFYAGVVYVPEPSVFAALFTAFPIAIWIQRQYKRQA